MFKFRGSSCCVVSVLPPMGSATSNRFSRIPFFIALTQLDILMPESTGGIPKDGDWALPLVGAGAVTVRTALVLFMNSIGELQESSKNVCSFKAHIQS